MKLFPVAIAAGALTFSAALIHAGENCPYSSDTVEAKAEAQDISITELAKAVTTKKSAKFAIFDANSKETRQQFGVIPGASLLSHYSEYNVTKELPSNKDSNVVFYCSSKRCSAAPLAAEKAIDYGYTNVYVLKEGIKGWNKAGQKVTKPKSS